MEQTIVQLREENQALRQQLALIQKENISLHQCNKRDQVFFRHGPLIFFYWRCAEGWLVEYVSPNITTILGYQDDDLTSGRIPYSSIIHPDDLERFASEVQIYSAEGRETFEHEYRLIHANGDICWIYDFTTIVRDPQGTVTHYYGYILDVTERKQSERRIHEREALLHSVLENSPAAIFVKDTEGRVVLANRQLESFFQCAPGSLIGTTAYDLASPEIAADVWESERQTLVTGTLLVREEQIPLGDEVRTFLSVKFPIFYDDGSPRFVGGILTDITELKQTQQAVQHSEERMRLVLDATNDGIWDWNIVTGEVFYSPRWQTMLGYQPGDLEGTLATWEHLLHPQDKQHTLQIIDDHMNSRIPPFTVEFRMQTKAGDWKWIRSRGKLVAWDDQGQPLRMLGTHTDIDEQKSLEDERDIFKKVIENAPDGFTLSNDHAIIYANPAFRAMTGLGDQIIGVHPGAVVHPDEHQRLRETIFPIVERVGLWRGTLRMCHYAGSVNSTSESWITSVSSIRIDDSRIKRAAIWRDITEQIEAEEERSFLQQQIIEAQNTTLHELAAPLLPIAHHTVLMPLIGSIDTQRAQQIMETLLEGVAAHRATIAIIEITGVQIVDTQVANALIQSAQAARLLGAQVVLTGIRPAIAQTLVQLGVDLSGIVTRGNLQAGITYALGTSSSKADV